MIRSVTTNGELHMSMFDSPRYLRNVLVADSLSCIATGALQVMFTAPLAQLLRLPPLLLQGTGWFLLAYAAIVGVVATRDPIPRGFAWLFVAGNFAWAAACAALLAAAPLSPSLLGEAWVVAQAVTVV